MFLTIYTQTFLNKSIRTFLIRPRIKSHMSKSNIHCLSMFIKPNHEVRAKEMSVSYNQLWFTIIWSNNIFDMWQNCLDGGSGWTL